MLYADHQLCSDRLGKPEIIVPPMTLDFTCQRGSSGDWIQLLHPEGACYYWHPEHVSLLPAFWMRKC
jgi:hypothetical protein